MSAVIEACVDSVESSVAAERGGANRLELCEHLEVGGTTPAPSLIKAVKSAVQVPVFVMIRPRGGPFVHSAPEVDTMRASIDASLAAGADGIVFGFLTEEGDVDFTRTHEFVARANGVPTTFHRAFDDTRNLGAALGALLDAGVSRVLTGGGPGRAIDNVDTLRDLVLESAGRVVVMAGGKVRGDNARDLVAKSGVTELHARCELDPERIAGIVRELEGVTA